MASLKQIITFQAKDEATSTINKVIGSNDKLEKSYDSLKNIALAAFAAIGGKAIIDSFAKQANAMQNLQKSTERAGLSFKEYASFASELQGITIFGDEDIANVIAYSAQFDSLKDRLKETTPLILDFATVTGRDLAGAAEYLAESLALPADGMNRLEAEGIVLSEASKQLARTLQDEGKVAEAQAVLLSELEARYKGAAIAARDNLQGALKSLMNTLGDTGEVAGAVADALGKDFVENINELVSSFNSFAGSVEGIEKLASTFGGLKAAFSGITDILLSLGSDLFDLFIKPLNQAAENAGGFNEILKTTVKGLSAVGGAISYLASGLKQIGQLIFATGEAFYNFAEAASKALVFDFTGAKNSFDNLISDGKRAFEDIVATGNKANQDILKYFNFEGIDKKFDNEAKKAEKAVEVAMQKITARTKETKEEIEKTGEAIGKLGKEAFRNSDSIISLFDNMKKAVQEGKAGADSYYDTVKKVLSDVGSLGSEIASLVDQSFSITSQSIQNQLDALQNQSEEEIKILEEKFEAQKTLQEEGFEAQKEKLLEEPISIQERNAQIQILEEERAAKESELLKKQEEEKKALEQKQALEAWQLQVKQFKADQAAAISNVWISAALGIMKGFEKGVIFGSINAATVTALAGVQTGVISSQEAPPKPFKTGGVVKSSVSGTRAVLGEGGFDEIVLPMSTFEKIAGGSSSGTIYINQVVVQANNVEELREQLLKIKDEQDGGILS